MIQLLVKRKWRKFLFQRVYHLFFYFILLFFIIIFYYIIKSNNKLYIICKQNNNKELEEWSEKDILDWVSKSRFSQYQPAFEGAWLDGDLLLRLDFNDLTKMGVTHPSHCKVCFLFLIFLFYFFFKIF